MVVEGTGRVVYESVQGDHLVPAFVVILPFH